MTYPVVPISSFCATGSGGTPSRAKAAVYYDGTIPWVKSGELREDVVLDTEEKITELALKESSTKLVPKGAVLIAMYGATIGRIAELGVNATTNQAVCHIVPDERAANTRYLYYALLSKVPELIAKGAGGAQPNINQQIIRDTRIPLPPLPEQKRIAAILDKADSIRRKRQEAVRLTEDLLRSVFLDMFGDPVTNPKGWVYKQLDALCTKITDGEHLNPTFADDGYPIVMANNVRSEGVIFDGVKYVSEEDFKKFTKKCRPERNDILMVSRGATIGRCTVVNTDLPFCLMGSAILLKTDNKVVLPAFLNWLLQHPAYQAKLYKTSSSSAQQAIYLSHIKGLSIPIPPITDQQKFSDLVIKGKKVSDFYSKSVIQSDTLCNSLLQHAFKGKL